MTNSGPVPERPVAREIEDEGEEEVSEGSYTRYKAAAPTKIGAHVVAGSIGHFWTGMPRLRLIDILL